MNIGPSRCWPRVAVGVYGRGVTDLPPLPERPADGHKGTFGKLLVVGGSRDMIGAPMLAAKAAYRAGCGYVIVAMPRPVLAAGLTVLPEAVGLGLDEDDDGRLTEVAREADALVIGPGLGRQPGAGDRVRALLKLGRPTVLDADGLTGLAGELADVLRGHGRVVLTPHPGEARTLTGEDVPTDDAGRRAFAERWAGRWGGTLLLKGARTVITDGRDTFINTTGDSTLAKAGSGDVLSGLIGTFLAQGLDPLPAARLAAHAHGLAGEHAGLMWTKRGAMAGDVCDAIPHALAAMDEPPTPPVREHRWDDGP